MARDKIDWGKLKLEFITDPQKPSPSEFAVSHRIPRGTMWNRSGREQWTELRESHWASVSQKAAPVIQDIQAVILARDVASKLSWISELKDMGLELARHITVQNSNAGYGEIITALERLEKLERLILGESTENVRVDDARAFAREVLLIVREEVMELATLERIASRVSGLLVGQRPGIGTDHALN